MSEVEVTLAARRYRIAITKTDGRRRELEVQQWHSQRQQWERLPASSPRRQWAISRALMAYMQPEVPA